MKFWIFYFSFFGFGGRFARKWLQIPLLFIFFFVFCDFSCFLLFWCSFFGGFLVEILDFYFSFFGFGGCFARKWLQIPLLFIFFSCFAIFLVFCYFGVVLFSAVFSLKFGIFYFSFFGFGGRFARKWLQIPLHFSSLFLCFAIFCVFCYFCVVLFSGVFFVEILDFLFYFFWLWRFRLKKASSPLTFHLFFVFCDFSCFLLFLCRSFFGVFFVEILDFLFFVFWLWRLFRSKMASNPLTFHLFVCALQFFVFSVIFVCFFFRRFFR